MKLLPGISAPTGDVPRVLRSVTTQLEDLFHRPNLNLKEMSVLRKLSTLEWNQFSNVNISVLLSSVEDIGVAGITIEAPMTIGQEQFDSPVESFKDCIVN